MIQDQFFWSINWEGERNTHTHTHTCPGISEKLWSRFIRDWVRYGDESKCGRNNILLPRASICLSCPWRQWINPLPYLNICHILPNLQHVQSATVGVRSSRLLGSCERYVWDFAEKRFLSHTLSIQLWTWVATIIVSGSSHSGIRICVHDSCLRDFPHAFDSKSDGELLGVEARVMTLDREYVWRVDGSAQHVDEHLILPWHWGHFLHQAACFQWVVIEAVQQLNCLMCRRLSTWSHALDHNWCPRFRKFTDLWAFNSPLRAGSKRRKMKSWFGSNDSYHQVENLWAAWIEKITCSQQ